MFKYLSLIVLALLANSAHADECYIVKKFAGHTMFLKDKRDIEDAISGPVSIQINNDIAKVEASGSVLGEFKELNNGFYILTGTPSNHRDKITTIEILTINKNLHQASLIKAINNIVIYNYNTKEHEDMSDIQMLSGDYSPCQNE